MEKFKRVNVYHTENIYDFITADLAEITAISGNRVVWLLLF